VSQPIAFLPGLTPSAVQAGRPLGRFLPPIQVGSASAWLQERLRSKGGWLLEPFGASPEVPVEIARAGYRLLAAVNNPIARFLIELQACPPSESELRAALAELASAQRAGERIEPHIRALYQTECTQCSHAVEAQAFIWDREANIPVGKIYNCPYCKDNGERPASPADIQRAAGFAASGLHHARALERVAALDDPDRGYAEEALSVYLPRAVYGLFTLVNRLDSFPSARRRLISALLLAAFDQANVLWAYPAKSYRPRQLNIPPRFQEKNLWLALENAVEAWSSNQGVTSYDQRTVPVTTWPDLPPESGGICLFEGRLKDLATQFLETSDRRPEIVAALTALPRPNQAFWTLSALWAGWLWGQAASSLFKSVLRRRRYDWSWHSVALHSAFSSLAPLLEPGTPCVGLMGEPEAGFLSASVVAADLSGLHLEGIALRTAPEQAQLTWIAEAGHPTGAEKLARAEKPAPAEKPAQETSESAWQKVVQRQVKDYLRQRGEPAHYLPIHTAALDGLAQAHLLSHASGQAQASGQPQPTEQAGLPTASPAESLHQVETSIEAALTQGGHFAHYAGSSRSLETGQWWLDETTVPAAEIAEPLADRLEVALVHMLQEQPEVQLHEVDRRLCQEFPALQTPELELVQQCLESYADPVQAEADQQPENGHWKLRLAETPQRRRTDLAEMQLLLMQTGKRLGFKLVKPESKGGSGARPALVWQNQTGVTQFSFYLVASGVLGRIVLPDNRHRDYTSSRRSVIVLPGSRAGWVEYRLRRDPRLRNAVENGWLLVKFRHVRWLAQNDNLSQENLEELLALDPLANKDQQMQLL
jgi:hypothetical protein